jgi:hypothetical protein
MNEAVREDIKHLANEWSGSDMLQVMKFDDPFQNGMQITMVEITTIKYN